MIHYDRTFLEKLGTVLVAFITAIIIALSVSCLAAGDAGPPICKKVLIIWILWIFRWLLVVTSFPTFTVEEEGLRLHISYWDKFLYWDDIDSVEQFLGQVYVSSKRLTAFNSLYGILSFRFKPVFAFTRWHKRYAEVMSVFEDKIGEKVKR